jgi:glucosamine kinase
MKPARRLVAPILPRRPVRWLVGVDGGGTRTRARIALPGGTVLGDGEAGPSALGQGVAGAWQQVHEAAHRAAAQAGLAEFDLAHCALGAGLSGACLPAHAHAFEAANPGCAALLLDTDGYAALLGAFGGAPGALLVAGTGSVCEALFDDGHRTVAGGWGWKLGDEGSGAWLGKEALRHAERALDGRDTAGPLAAALFERIGPGAEALLAWGDAAGQRELATLAPLVFEHAERDPAALCVLDQAAAELAALARAADPQAALPLALAGSVAERLRPRLAERLHAARGTVAKRLSRPLADATAGALFMIRQALAPTAAP